MNGQEASRLAIESIVDNVLPRVREGQTDGASWEELLRHGVERPTSLSTSATSSSPGLPWEQRSRQP